MRAIRWVFLTAGIVGLVGCSSSFESNPLEPGELGSEVQILGVLPINWQDNYDMHIFDNKVALLGTTAALVLEKGRETRRRDFTQAVNDSEYDYRDDFTLALGAALAEQGFSIEAMPYQRKPHPQAGRVLKGRFEDPKNYPVGRTPYRAFLDIYVDYVGMGSAGVTTDFHPTYHVGVRVVDGEDGEILYQHQIQYNSFADEEESVERIPPNDDYRFTDYNDIMADVDRAKAGMHEAVIAVADAIAKDLGRARDDARAEREMEQE